MRNEKNVQNDREFEVTLFTLFWQNKGDGNKRRANMTDTVKFGTYFLSEKGKQRCCGSLKSVFLFLFLTGTCEAGVSNMT